MRIDDSLGEIEQTLESLEPKSAKDDFLKKRQEDRYLEDKAVSKSQVLATAVLTFMGLVFLGCILLIILILVCRYAYGLFYDFALLKLFLTDLWEFVAGAVSASGVISTVILFQNKKNTEAKS